MGTLRMDNTPPDIKAMFYGGGKGLKDKGAKGLRNKLQARSDRR
jgi:hypothetical protein